MENITEFFDTCNEIGVTNILLFITCFLLFVMIFGLYKGFSTGKIFDLMAEQLHKKRLASYAEDEKKSYKARLDATPKILLQLTNLLHDVGADRAAVLELHNGKSNPKGLPFVYCDMSYEVAGDDMDGVQDEYENINLSRYPFFDYLHQHKFFIGTVNELSKIDKRAANKLKLDESKYLIIYTLENDGPIGFLQLTFNTSDPHLNEDEVRANMLSYTQKIGRLLDYSVKLKV